ncbi:MFS transporter [Paraburkholderia susongensis]|uniref:Major Facilitator Superfamily protein n=1 Tax=Paraburkholderia susongensis TaxID=1515439 RepID=A0A1X7KYP2_9BURK|nr:MFS transporter [Paraburkholderia susongensis]SMG46540.1 Major Facilitator Superfamily protein [Paraburkholderia susongensis]
MEISLAATANPVAEYDERLIRRVWWKIMPLVMVTYLVSVVDKMNVSFAKLQMVHQIGLSETAYGLASSLFFIGYLIFEIPSALGVHRFGAPKWIFRIMLSWGIATVLLAYTSSGSMFAALRFLVGAAEAGLYPGLVYYLTVWLPRRYQVRAVALLTLGSALGNMLGSAFGGMLLSLDGTLNHAGWQWVFIVTGAFALVLSPIVLLCLPRSIETARFLEPGDRARLAKMVTDEAPSTNHEGTVWTVLRDPVVMAFALGYTLLLTSLYGIIYWLPTVIKGFGVSSSLNGLLTMLPWALTAVLLLTVPRMLKRDSEVRVAAAAIGTIGCVAFVVSLLVSDPVYRYIALVLGTPCTSLLLPCFWSLPSKYFSGRRAAASLAAISSIGNFGGFLAQNAMPWIGKTLGHASYAMLLPALCLLLLGGTAFAMELANRRAPVNPSAL